MATDETDLAGGHSTPPSEHVEHEATSPHVEHEAASPPFMIVGVGASAGGFEAFKELLEALPPSPGIALIFVQHLDPGHESMLQTLLARLTKMKVLQVQENVRVEPNHVYVAPPSGNVVILHGILSCQPVDAPLGRRRTIDFFFRSLAADQGSKAVGVLLSGTASDGTLGMKMLKSEGGITLVQDEKTARFDSMPRAAVVAGVADLVLPPRDIAKELMRIKEHYPHVIQSLRMSRGERAPADGDVLHSILARVWAVSNVDFSYYKPTTLRRRILRRVVLNKLSNFPEYLRFIEENPTEVQALYQDLVISVTSFFRDGEVFEALKADVFPRIVENKMPHAALRLWVPGCSTGEEVYSLAIALLQFLGERAATVPVQIFGTDISESAIDRARTGIYPDSVESDIPEEVLERFFVKRDGSYQIAKPVRDVCVFARQNVFKDPPFSNLDLISCRNVLIYFGPELQRRVLPLFHYALNPTGFLVLGNSESIGAFADYFALAHPKYRIFSRKAAVAPPLLDFSRAEYGLEREGLPRHAREEGARNFDPQREADRMLLDRYGPPSVLVNRDMNILQFRGRTGPFLEPAPGAPNLNVLRMAREGLMVALHTAIHEAGRTGAPTRQPGMRFRTNGDVKRVDLHVIPLNNPSSAGEKFFLVLFENFQDAGGPHPPEPPAPERAPSATDDGEMVRLREELTATKEYLQSIIESQEAFNEELRSANEEILSSNEELQSTNEELETAKEELQSANEELTTLNEELQTRNADLGKANDDLNNLLNSVNIAIVMLDGDLRVRRFTPLAEKVMNLISGDVGRPLADINPRIIVPDLGKNIREVIDSLTPSDLDVRDVDGRWYNLRIRPYKTVDNRIEGALLAVLDVDAAKRSAGRAARTQAFADAVLDMVGQPILMLTPDLRVEHANGDFHETFGLRSHETKGRSLYELAGGRWDLPDLRRAIEGDLRSKGSVDDLPLAQSFPGVGSLRFKVSARLLAREQDGEPRIVLTVRGIERA